MTTATKKAKGTTAGYNPTVFNTLPPKSKVFVTPTEHYADKMEYYKRNTTGPDYPEIVNRTLPDAVGGGIPLHLEDVPVVPLDELMAEILVNGPVPGMICQMNVRVNDVKHMNFQWAVRSWSADHEAHEDGVYEAALHVMNEPNEEQGKWVLKDDSFARPGTFWREYFEHPIYNVYYVYYNGKQAFGRPDWHASTKYDGKSYKAEAPV